MADAERPTPREQLVIDLGDQRLAAAIWGDGDIGIVLLHDGLGSISQWPVSYTHLTLPTILLV